jgi:hypothetical protein
MAFCRNCGNKLEDGAKFCPNCGTPTDGNAPSSAKLSKKKSKKGVLITAIVSLIALIGVAVWCFFGNQNRYSLEGLAKVTVDCDYIKDFHEGLAFFEKDEKLGVVNKMGEIIVEPSYDSNTSTIMSFYEDGIARVCKNDKYGFIDKKGKEMIPCVYEDVKRVSEGLIGVKKDGKYGFVDKKGQVIIPFEYEDVTIFSEGLSAVEKDGKYGYINKKGETVIPFIYDYANPFEGDATSVVKGDNYSIINKEGKVMKDFKSGQLRDFSDGLAIYENDEGKYGYVDEKGNLVIPCVYYAVEWNFGYFKEGYAGVYKQDMGKFGVIDKSGKTVLPFKYDGIEYSEGLFCVDENDKAGFYDTNGKNVISCTFDEAASFSEGLAAVKQGKLWGFIDKFGKIVISPMFDEASDFSDGLAVVKKNGKYGIVDKKGNSTFDFHKEGVGNTTQSKIQDEEDIQVGEEVEQAYTDEQIYSNENESEYDNQRSNVDISNILYECQTEIRSIQSEIESVCNTFVQLGSGDVDMLTYGKLKSTMISDVMELERRANRVFDDCIKKLNELGETNAANNMQEEKKKFYQAAEHIKFEAQQRAEAL